MFRFFILGMKLSSVVFVVWSLVKATSGWTYHYSNHSVNWAQARKECRQNFTDLVVIQSQAENDYLVSVLPNRSQSPYYWIGITKNHINEPWRWVGDNSTWIGNQSWASNEPNNNHSTEFCVEIYVNNGPNRGRWNDEKCSKQKFPVCYKAQCNTSSCDRGRCVETVNKKTCLCDPGYDGERCQTGPAVSANGSWSAGEQTFSYACLLRCHLGALFRAPSGATCECHGPRPTCSAYRRALLAVSGCGAASWFFCLCFCWMKRRKRKNPIQGSSDVRTPQEEVAPEVTA